MHLAFVLHILKVRLLFQVWNHNIILNIYEVKESFCRNQLLRWDQDVSWSQHTWRIPKIKFFTQVHIFHGFICSTIRRIDS